MFGDDEGFELRRVFGGVGGDFAFVFLSDDLEPCQFFGGGVDRGTVFVEGFGDFCGGLLAVFDEPQVDFGLEVG